MKQTLKIVDSQLVSFVNNVTGTITKEVTKDVFQSSVADATSLSKSIDKKCPFLKSEVSKQACEGVVASSSSACNNINANAVAINTDSESKFTARNNNLKNIKTT